MSETAITILLQGEGAGEAGEELARLIAAFEGGAEVRVVPPEEAPDEVRRALDPISLAALVLSIPGAVLAVMNIADRIEKRRSAKRLLDEGRRLGEAKAVQAFVLLPDGSPKRLQDFTPDELLDLVAQLRLGSEPG